MSGERKCNAVGTVGKVAAAVVDVTIWVDKTHIAGADCARRANVRRNNRRPQEPVTL